MTRWWISFITNNDLNDYRPTTYPPPKGILGYWCSGYDAEERPIACVAVEAESETEALSLIGSPDAWPEMRGKDSDAYRFVEQRESDWVPGDRFPLTHEWCKERFA